MAGDDFGTFAGRAGIVVFNAPMDLQPMPDRRPILPSATDEPLNLALPGLLARRHLTISDLGGLLRAEGIAISRARLHQLATGTGAPPTADQLERIASVLGVSPTHFAEYRLWRTRALLDPGVVGFDRAMANFTRLRGRRATPIADDDSALEAASYPPPVTSQSKERE